MPSRLALGVRGTVAGHSLGALEGGGVPPPSNAHLRGGGSCFGCGAACRGVYTEEDCRACHTVPSLGGVACVWDGGAPSPPPQVRLRRFERAQQLLKAGLLQHSPDLCGVIRDEAVWAWVGYYALRIWDVEAAELEAMLAAPDCAETPCRVEIDEGDAMEWAVAVTAAAAGRYVRAAQVFAAVEERLVKRGVFPRPIPAYGRAWAQFYATLGTPRRLPPEAFEAEYRRQEEQGGGGGEEGRGGGEEGRGGVRRGGGG